MSSVLESILYFTGKQWRGINGISQGERKSECGLVVECHSLLCSSPALLLSHIPDQSNSPHLLLSPAYHLQSSQYICSLTPLTLCQSVFTLMSASPALFPGLLTWYRPDLPLTIASHLCPGKFTSLLSLTTTLPTCFLFLVCLWLVVSWPVPAFTWWWPAE